MAQRIADIDTPRGPARAALTGPVGSPISLLLLGHGAGGDVDAVDLVAVRDLAVTAGVAVGLITQPYRRAGRRAPAPAAHLDEAWTAVVRELTAAHPRVPLVVGGRSSGARVACRTAGDCAAAAVVALAFPLHPPGRPERSRASELPGAVPTLVVNGDRDPFGIPTAGGSVSVVVLPGERHTLSRDPAGTARVVVGWLAGLALADAGWNTGPDAGSDRGTG